VSSEEFGFAPGASLRPPTGPEDDSLVIENVQPGHYRVRISNIDRNSYSSITCGGTDLQRQPLVVGLGGRRRRLKSPCATTVLRLKARIESTTTAEVRSAGFNSPGQSPGNVYFVPMADTVASSAWLGFPGWEVSDSAATPRCLPRTCLDRQQPDLEYASDEIMVNMIRRRGSSAWSQGKKSICDCH